jgi:hypothetical protein
LSYCYCDPLGANFLWDFLTTLFAILKTKLKYLLDISQALLIGLPLSMGFWNKRTTGYVKSVRCLPDNSGILHYLSVIIAQSY